MKKNLAEWVELTVNRFAFGERGLLELPAMVLVIVGYTVWFLFGV